jgi:hypothetical protein
MTKKTIFAFAMVSLSLAACVAQIGPDGTAESVANVEQAQIAMPPRESIEQDGQDISVKSGFCAPPHIAPAYTRPPDDTIAFATLIDGAGYAGAGNSNWTDIASGNVCGQTEKELVLVKNAHSDFSIMHGPVPFPVGTFDSVSSAAHPWRGVATLDVDGAKDGFDEIVAVRHVTASGVPDLVVMKVSAACDDAKVIESATIGNPGNSDWVDVAVGNFDGTGKQIALLKASHSNFFLVRPSGLAISFISDLATLPGMPWKQVAAGDLDGDGTDELVVARQVKDGKNPTVLVFKWMSGDFHLVATSGFGNTGNSDWTGMTVGDFNGDNHAVIALQKNEHSNFAMLELVKGELRELATKDLDSHAGQPWRGITAVDWLGGDLGAQELVAVRAARDAYRADLFVYGDPFQRRLRDTTLAKVKAQWDQHDSANNQHGDVSDWLSSVADTHTNLLSMVLERVGDYDKLVETLEKTKNFCVEGRQLRVAVTLPPWSDMRIDSVHRENSLCAFPPMTTLDDRLDFQADTTDMERCKDVKAWGKLLGRLARTYPHLVMFGLDDFMKNPDNVPSEDIAEMQSNMRSQAPWMSFVPVAYYDDPGKHPDVMSTVDNVVFFFKNDHDGTCIDGTCGEESIVHFQDEVAHVASYLPAGRNMQIGIYYGLYFGGQATGKEGTVKYDFDLTRMALQMPELGGVTAYPIEIKTTTTDCPATGTADEKYCVLKALYPIFH